MGIDSWRPFPFTQAACLKTLGAIVVGNTPQEFTAYLEKDVERWERVIAASGLKPE